MIVSTSSARVLGRPAGWLASMGGIGLLPSVPGTWASLATLPVGWLLMATWGWVGVLAGALIVFAVGVWASSDVIRFLDVEDPSVVVIDEMAGQLLVLAVTPLSWEAYALAFCFFRIFDWFKPWPVSWADNDVAGGLGAMADDMLDGLYALAIIVALDAMEWI